MPRPAKITLKFPRLSRPGFAPGRRLGWGSSRWWLVGLWGTIVAASTGFNPTWLQWLDLKTQSQILRLRGPQTPPTSVVILAIDGESLDQGAFYRTDPDRFSDLAPIQNWPWQRQAYSIAIQRLMDAGAKVVALDVLFLQPSSYGPQDDRALISILERYPQQIVLGAAYEEESGTTGLTCQVAEALPEFRATGVLRGFLNFPVAVDQKIRQFGDHLGQVLLEKQRCNTTLPSFARATLAAAQIPVNPREAQGFLSFYGPHQSFLHIPFWKVLDRQTWPQLRQSQLFQDRIVLIGSTEVTHQDFHPTVFLDPDRNLYTMAGVEFHATAIANLQTQQVLQVALPNPLLRSLLALGVMVGLTASITHIKNDRLHYALLVTSVLGCLALGFITQTHFNRLLPVASLSLGLVGFLGHKLSLDVAAYYQRQKRLRKTLSDYAAVPVVREIMSHDQDLHDLLQAKESAIIGRLLGRRYQITQVLGMGGFSETYTARDMQRPGQPICVVKQLRVDRDNPAMLAFMRRSFNIEAETLETLGKHPQIPQLLAYFEEDEQFYLIQEFIPGISLMGELLGKHMLPLDQVLGILLDLLPVLAFVHDHGVIHRDLKPSNIMRRDQDNRLVLLDFGIAKLLSTAPSGLGTEENLTIGIGTKGYMPQEQAAGYPNFSSDLYALGIIALQGLTGLKPKDIPLDCRGELDWLAYAPDLSPGFITWLTTLVQQDCKKRYSSAIVALEALKRVEEFQRLDPQTLPSSLENWMAPNPEQPTPRQGETQDGDDSGDILDNTRIWNQAHTPADDPEKTEPWQPDRHPLKPKKQEEETQIWHRDST